MRSLPEAERNSVAMKAVTVVAVLVTTATAAFSGTMAGSDSKLAVILPVTVVVGGTLAVLALTRFKIYVMVMLIMRSGMDLAKLSVGGGPTAAPPATDQVATDQVAARGVDPSSLLGVLFIVAALIWLTAQYRKYGRLPGSPLRRALVVFAAACFLSILGAGEPPVSILELLRILAVVLMFVVLERLMTDERTMRQLLAAIYLSLLFPLAFTTFGFLTGHPASEEKGDFTRITGPFLQSNTFGRYLMLMIIFGVAIYPHLDKRFRRLLGGALALSCVFLPLTYTRTAIVGVVIGLGVVGLIQSKRLLFGMIMFSVCALLLVPQLSARFTGLSESPTWSVVSGSTNNSLVWRLGYWTEVLPLANSNPVTGIGLDMTERETDQEKQPHNDFIRVYVETGLIGLGAYVALLISLVTLGRRAVRASPRRSLERGIGAGFLGCALAFIADSVSANVISSVVTLWYLFAFAAAASAVVAQQRRRAEGGPAAGLQIGNVRPRRMGPLTS
jgi:putative inorganic carbon (hco3(-)) transporter